MGFARLNSYCHRCGGHKNSAMFGSKTDEWCLDCASWPSGQIPKTNTNFNDFLKEQAKKIKFGIKLGSCADSAARITFKQ